MTDFKIGDEVLVKVKIHQYANNGKAVWVITPASETKVGGLHYFQTDDLIPALDVNKQLLEALKPFAKLAAMFDHDVDDSWGIACESTGPIRIRDLRRARDALAAAEKGV